MSKNVRGSRAKKRQREALFRHQVISRVHVLVLKGEVRADAVREVAGSNHFVTEEKSRKVSERTLYRWIAAYDEKEMLASLEPSERERTETSVVLPETFIDFIRKEKKNDPRASSPELIRRARILKIIEPHSSIDRSTVWRACKRMDLSMKRRPQKREGDMRRYAYPHRMMMVLCDGKYFRAGATRKKRVALFFLDDATRRGLYVVVGTSESTGLFLRSFFEMILAFGYTNVVYMDNGPGFISDDTKFVIANLPHVHLINGTAGYPEGRGKIERFNQTALAHVLRSLDGAAEVDPDCEALTLRLNHFLFNQYNNRPHESLGKKTPNECWNADECALRFPTSVDELRDRFVVTEARKGPLETTSSLLKACCTKCLAVVGENGSTSNDRCSPVSFSFCTTVVSCVFNQWTLRLTQKQKECASSSATTSHSPEMLCRRPRPHWPMKEISCHSSDQTVASKTKNRRNCYERSTSNFRISQNSVYKGTRRERASGVSSP